MRVDPFEKHSDSIYAVINKSAMEAFGFSTPHMAINQILSISLVDTLAILGVIDNYHQESLKEEFKPTVYLLINDERRFLSIKRAHTNLGEFLAFAESQYLEIFPEGVFEYRLLDDHIKAQYQSEDKFLSAFLIFATLAITIALLGLTGLAFYITEQRRKEVSIRKFLGSSSLNVFALLSSSMLKNVLIANLLAFPLIIYYSNEWLNGFAFRQGFHYSTLMISLLMSLGTALAIISFQVIKTALSNPIITLRNE